MTEFQITDLKHFMEKLLKTDCFDDFLLREAVITVAHTFSIDGRIVKEFYSSEEAEDPALLPYPLACWSALRPICFSLIKGKRTPVSLKFILYLKPEKANALIQESGSLIPANMIEAFVLTLRYRSGVMSCISALSLSDFLADKTAERLWAEAVRRFLLQKGISFQEP